MRLYRATTVFGGALIVAAALMSRSITPAAAQQATDRSPPMDELQRADQIYQFKKAAVSGAERGREIFYYKCWFCHNEFTKDVPKLEGLFTHATLWSGQLVTDDTVKNQIRNGSADMAAYKYALSEDDLNDLVAFLREKCCWNSDAPPLNPAYRASAVPAPGAAQSDRLRGGPHGIVKSAEGYLLEGMMVQLIAKNNTIRTTVFTDGDGRYEFPQLVSGAYTLHIAQPREFFAYARDGVDIDGATALPDIVLKRIAKSDVLPPSAEIAAQMTGSEWLMSLSGSGAEKRLLTVNCNWCHSYQQIFRNRYDEAGWSKILHRMIHGAGSPLINVNSRGRRAAPPMWS